MIKIKTEKLFQMIIDAVTDHGKTREELYDHFNKEVSTGTISARCNDLLKLNIVKQSPKKKKRTKTGCWAFVLELNPNRIEWLPYAFLQQKDTVSDDFISSFVKILKKSDNRKHIFYELVRQIPRKKLKKLLGACHA